MNFTKKRRTERAATHPGMAYSILLMLLAITSVLTASCGSSETPSARSEKAPGDIGVNAPASGSVLRVLVSEGAAVEQDAVLVELAPETNEASADRSGQEDRQNAREAARAAGTEMATIKAEARNAADKVRRLEKLVLSGKASGSELEAARRDLRDSQQRLQEANERVRTAQLDRASTMRASRNTLAVKSPASGTVRALNVQVGQQVTNGQEIATISPQK